MNELERFVGFLLFVGTIVNSQACDDSQRDVVILLDSSGSVAARNFHKSKLFIVDLIGDFDIGKEKVQVGMVLFHTRASRVMWLNDFSVKSDMKIKVERIRHKRGSTATGEALRFTNENILTPEYGDRPDVPDLVIVITDGKSDNQTETKIEAERLHKRGVDVISIGVGDDCDKDELLGIASDSKFALVVDNFDGLGDLQGLLSQAACEGLKQTTKVQTTLTDLKTTTEIQTTNTQETTTGLATSTLASPTATNTSPNTDTQSTDSTKEQPETTTGELSPVRIGGSGSLYELFSETTPESKSTSVYESFKVQTELTSTTPDLTTTELLVTSKSTTQGLTTTELPVTSKSTTQGLTTTELPVTSKSTTQGLTNTELPLTSKSTTQGFTTTELPVTSKSTTQGLTTTELPVTSISTTQGLTTTELPVTSKSTTTEPNTPSTTQVSSTYGATSSVISTSSETKLEPPTTPQITTVESRRRRLTAAAPTTRDTYTVTLTSAALISDEKVTQSNVTAGMISTETIENDNEADEGSDAASQKSYDLFKEWGVVAGLTTAAAFLAVASFGTLIWFLKRRRGNMDVTKDNQQT